MSNKIFYVFIILFIALSGYAFAYDITACGYYTLENTDAIISNLTVDASPCFELWMNNVTLRCDEDIYGTGGTFAYIKYMNNSIIEGCNIDGFLLGILIPDGYYDAIYSENNIFRNISIQNIDSSAFGFDIRTSYSQMMNNTVFYNNYVNNAYANQAFSFYGDGMDNFNINNNMIINSYNGIIAYYLTNAEISNNIINGGTIYGISLIGMTNTYVSNNNIANIAICGISLNGASNITFYSNLNSIDNLGMGYAQFCMGEYESTINPISSYNLGWFPTNPSITLITAISDLSYYNISKSYDVIYEDPNYIMVFNNTKSYFIYPACQENWVKQVMPCFNSIKLINYTDTNSCLTQNNVPIDSGAYEECQISTNIRLDSSQWLPLVFFLMIISFSIIGIWIPPSLIISGILSILSSVMFKGYFPQESSTVIFWIFMGLGIALIIGGLLYTLTKAQGD